MNHSLFAFVLIVLLSMSGCGNGSKVTGKVSFADGQPLTVGKVMFTNGTMTAFGKINARGEFRMGMVHDGDGIPTGTYQVYITEALQPGDSTFAYADEDGKTVTPLVLAVDPKFTVASQSGLVCEVKGTTTFDIKVEKPGKNYNPRPTEDTQKQSIWD